MVQLTLYTKVLLGLAPFCFLLPLSMAEKMNAFDAKLFSIGMRDIVNMVNKMESSLTTNLAFTNEGLEQLENTVSSLQLAVSACREDLNNNKRQWEEGLTKMSIVESSLIATGEGMAENKRDLTNLLATVSSIQTSLSATRDALSINQREWHDGLAKISFIESSVNATRDGMDDNTKDLANVLATMVAIQSSLNAAREEITENKKNWDNAMVNIQSVQSSVLSTRDDLAANKQVLNDVSSTISTLQSAVSATREDLNANKNELNKVKEVLPSIQATLGTINTEISELWRNVNIKKLRCKEGWYSFEGSCYFFSQTTTNWHTGREKCLSMGSDFVKISSNKEFDFLLNLLTGNTWTGMNDIDVENSYKWVSDNTQAQINKAWFHSTEPNNNGNEDCVEFYNAGGIYKLNDVPCNVSDRKFMCEMSPTVRVA